MGKSGGVALRAFSTFLYVVELICGAIVLGTYSYFLARLAANNLPINVQWEAVEGLAGAIVLYSLFAVFLTCCLGGIKFFAVLAIFLNILMCGASVANAILAKDGASSCKGFDVQTPLGSGPASTSNPYYGTNNFGFGPKVNTSGYQPDLGLACRLNSAAFAVSVIAAVLFLLSAFMQFWVSRHHQQTKKYIPPVRNDYAGGPATSWTRGNYNPDTASAPVATYGAGAPAADVRKSDVSGFTGTTYGNSDPAGQPPMAENSVYGAEKGAGQSPTSPTGHYHRGPVGTGIKGGTATNF